MSGSNVKTILFIEDDRDIRGLYVKILSYDGYRVIEAVDGEDGISKFMASRDDVDILVTDVDMPNMNGLTAYIEMRKLKEDLKVIFTSGHHAELNFIIQGDGYHYLQKPFAPEVLLQKVKDVLEDSA